MTAAKKKEEKKNEEIPDFLFARDKSAFLTGEKVSFSAPKKEKEEEEDDA